jgi:hypothetical protein
MSDKKASPLPKPRWDGSRVMFEIEAGGELITCAISRSALQELSGRRHFAAPELLRCFVEIRAKVEAIALHKYAVSPDSVCGILSIWEDDIEAVPVATVATTEIEQRV